MFQIMKSFVGRRAMAVGAIAASAIGGMAATSAEAGTYCYPARPTVVRVEVQEVHRPVQVCKPVKRVYVPVQKVYVPVTRVETVETVETVRVYTRPARTVSCY
jgi:hypothetical protein